MGIIGHHKEWNTLLSLHTKKTVPGSLLFSGPESIGKCLVAEQFAITLLDQEGAQTDQDTLLDMKKVSPEQVVKRGVTRKKSIGVEVIRESLHFLKISTQSSFRVLIIDDAHLLTVAAQNMLLKFVEEPEARTVLIFITHERQKLLETLLSRLFEVRFGFVGEEILKNEGRQYGLEVSTDIPEFFFRLGRPGILFQAKENPKQFAQKKALLTKLYQLSTLSLKERLSLAEELSKDISLSVQLFEWFLPGLYVRVKALSDKEQIKKHLALLDLLQDTLIKLKEPGAQGRLVLEQLFLSLA